MSKNKKTKKCIVCDRTIRSGYKYCYEHRNTNVTNKDNVGATTPLEMMMGYTIAIIGSLGMIALVGWWLYSVVVENLLLIGWAFIGALIILIVAYIFGKIRDKKEKKEEIKLEVEKLIEKSKESARNLESMRISKEEEATRSAKEEIVKAEEMKLTINQVIEKIKKFQPIKRFKVEKDYQNNLAGYLQPSFKKVRIEEQRGGSRPDIIINDEIAIEIKGPTTMDELKTLPDKCMRYPTSYDEVIVVLFDIQLSNEKLESYLNLLKGMFPNIIIIKK